MSYRLRQLADELGAELLTQHGRGIQLTAAARTVLRHAEALHAQAERAHAQLASISEEPSGSFTLCGFSTAATHLLPPAAAALRERYPHVRVRVIEAEPDRCFDLLLAGDADLALVINTAGTPPTADERFDQQPLLDDPLDLVVPAGTG
ncbi:transcriptional regulator, LysR family [Saccharopolyspora erythraea NRRL 2338]|uniref:Transcriptional regulator, LysR family n=2 Tax=Saccharopolyspora erythraea TaxID=1836 RepID=A4FIS2_SACEN|nr:LysR substrate-binding domain-containing protein [Saccharopolyspora erythraea]CAM03947.1 transcriptional regulator, LysR family [Saccharopolyspora erythraea NRRL 2338]